MDFHNRKNIRQVNHDYSQPCTYFITINVKLGQCLFGKGLSSTEIELNELGKTAQKFWIEIPEHFRHARLDEFIIMPNHMHGIIHIGDSGGHHISWPYGADSENTTPTAGDVRARHVVPDKTTIPNHFGPLPKGSLAVVISQYKSSVTRWANQNRFGGIFSWHSRFYDRIISDPSTLMAAQIYIRRNPEKWWEKYQNQSW
jgi:hypothetical protein